MTYLNSGLYEADFMISGTGGFDVTITATLLMGNGISAYYYNCEN